MQEKTRKDEVVRFRISAEEKKLLEAAALREHLDLSQWIRVLVLKAASASQRSAKGK